MSRVTEQLRHVSHEIPRRDVLLSLGGLLTGSVFTAATFEMHTIEGWINSSGGPFLNPYKANIGHVLPNENWVHFAGDPNAKDKAHPRDWHRVGIMAMKAVDINALQSAHPEDGFQAIAFVDPGNNAQCAFSPDSRPLFGLYLNDKDPHTSYYGIAARIGPGDLRAVGGLYLPKTNLFVYTQTIAGPATTTDEIARKFPGIGYI
jgi:hypothetical protein